MIDPVEVETIIDHSIPAPAPTLPVTARTIQTRLVNFGIANILAFQWRARGYATRQPSINSMPTAEA